MANRLVYVFAGLYAVCVCQNMPNTNNDSLPKERGIIISTIDKEDSQHSIVRHLPVFPGYENFSGKIPGIKIMTQGKTHVLSVDVDFRNKTFYMYDYHLRSILLGTGYHTDLEAENMEVHFMHIGVSTGTVQLAVDWLSHTVYWTDSVFRWIVAAPGQLDKLEKDYFKIIVDQHLDAPDGLALDPINGYLFWSDNGRHPKIERSDMLGNDRHTIVTKHLVSPQAMDADRSARRIYWIDSYTDSILSASYEGAEVNMVARVPAATLFDIAIFRDVVYITDIRNGNMYTLNKTTGREESTSLDLSPETIYGIAVYGEETQPLKDKDYCRENACDHICISEKASAKCVCSEGYVLNTTTRQCEESYAAFHRAIVIANSTHVCMLDIRSFAHAPYDLVCKFSVLPSSISTAAPPTSTASPAPTVAPGESITLIDIDVLDRVLFIVTENNKIYKRPIDLPIEDDAKEMLTQAAGNVSGLAYDTAYSDNLFWCESDRGYVWVVNVATGTVRRIITENNINNPKNIVVLPKPRKLAWVAGTRGNMSVQTMDMDGNNLETVVSGYKDIVGLVFNNEAQVFYFASVTDNIIYRATLNGSTSTVIDDVSVGNVSELVHYNNYLAWIYRNSSRNIMRTYDIEFNVAVGHVLIDNYSPVVGFKMLDTKSRLPEEANPCAYQNGGCSQICITKYSYDVMTKACECALGFELEPDKVSCKSELVKDDFILVTDWTYNVLHQIDLKTHDIKNVLNKEGVAYLGVYVDTSTNRIIWSEQDKSQIFSSNLDGSDLQTIGDIGRSQPYRMDKDLTTGNLYYTSFTNPHIGLLTPSGENFLLKTGFTGVMLGDIVVHPAKGWMYYAVYVHGYWPYVARANMDGTNEFIILQGNKVLFPDGLAIDFTRDHLYWSDAHWDTIQRCDLDGKGCVTIVNKTGTYQPEEIRDLVTDGTYLYYSAYRKDHVVRVNLTAPYETVIVGQSPGLGKLDTIALYTSDNKNIQPVSDSCKARNGRGDCSTICVPTKTGRTCACEGNASLRPDGRTCSNIYQCSYEISQEVKTNTSTKMIDILIDSACLRYLHDNCSYKCPDLYEPVNEKALTVVCTNIGWDREEEPLCKGLACKDSSFPNGNIRGQCSHRIGDVCMIECENGYKKTTDSVTCNNNFEWFPKNPCVATVSVHEQQTGLPVAGVATGIVILILIIIALVVVIIFIIRKFRARKSGESYYGNASVHQRQDGTIAIENPGYLPSGTSVDFNKDEHPYSTVDSQGVWPNIEDRSIPAGREPLPEVASLNVTQDTAVLTHDSWLKEQGKRVPDT